MNIIELRDFSLVLIKAKRNKSLIEVMDSKTIELNDGFKVNFNSPELSVKIIQSVKQFFNHERDCLLNLGITNVIYRDITTPKTSVKYLKALVKHELTSALNLTSDYLIDYAHVGEIITDNVKQNKLLVAAIQTNNLNEIIQFLTRCGLNIKKIDVLNHALINFTQQNKLLNMTENTIIVDVSSKQIRQFLFESGQFSYHRTTRINLDDSDESLNYPIVLDAIEKMIQFSIAQGRIKKLDHILVIGFPLTDPYLKTLEEELKLSVSRIELDKLVRFKQNDEAQFIYALSLLYKPTKNKHIDLMILYNTLNKKSDWVEKIEPAFLPTLAILTYFILTTLIIIVIKTSNTNKSIEEINAYLSQDEVMAKIFEITDATNRTNKMNEILVELENIQGVIDKMPRLNQTIITEIYAEKPDALFISKLAYVQNKLEVDIETIDSSLIYQYVTALKNKSFFKEITYNTYSRKATDGVYTSTITFVLKELE